MHNPLKVLVVDNDKDFTRPLAEELRRSNGWKVVTSISGRQALKTLDPSYDAVILDQQMPGLNGVDTLREIRRRYELDGVCVVMLTAFANVAKSAESIRLGAYRYLEKPFYPEALRPIVVAGVTRQRLAGLRRELLASPDLNVFLDRVSSIFTRAVTPEGPYMIFLGPDGSVERVQQGSKVLTRKLQRKPSPKGFVQRIVEQNLPIFDAADGVKALHPIMPEARCLLAAPVRVGNDRIAGIIDLESPDEHAFDQGWEDVLAYLADLAGMAIEIGNSYQNRYQAQVDAERSATESLRLVIREVAHRILTPVDIIVKQTDLLLNKDLASVQPLPSVQLHDLERRMKIISESASDISRVCDQLREESADISTSIKEVNLASLVQDSLDAKRDEFNQKRIELVVGTKAGKNLIVKADPHLLGYSLQCLLQNAVEAIEEARTKRPAKTGRKRAGKSHRQASPRDRIKVGIGVDAQASLAAVSVQDSGDGVPEQYRERLFVALFSSKKRPSPSGTGLFSVNRIMRLQGGSVELAANSLRGATFVLKIPLAS